MELPPRPEMKFRSSQMLPRRNSIISGTEKSRQHGFCVSTTESWQLEKFIALHTDGGGEYSFLRCDYVREGMTKFFLVVCWSDLLELCLSQPRNPPKTIHKAPNTENISGDALIADPGPNQHIPNMAFPFQTDAHKAIRSS
ncbi:hypothetical protein CEXT_687941 [Caerostris extrusa]|uniref:Uncharacterized protein n=1 Tax=Caerostris extrusa TaxID=172846 RepID=A0AAV4S8L1_CAEEX|nr:hypothetical protein CEXT_687941 [Caerostris extrusa]